MVCRIPVLGGQNPDFSWFWGLRVDPASDLILENVQSYPYPVTSTVSHHIFVCHFFHIDIEGAKLYNK